MNNVKHEDKVINSDWLFPLIIIHHILLPTSDQWPAASVIKINRVWTVQADGSLRAQINQALKTYCSSIVCWSRFDRFSIVFVKIFWHFSRLFLWSLLEMVTSNKTHLCFRHECTSKIIVLAILTYILPHFYAFMREKSGAWLESTKSAHQMLGIGRIYSEFLSVPRLDPKRQDFWSEWSIGNCWRQDS